MIPLVKIDDIARLTGLAVPTLRRLSREPGFPAYRPFGRTVLFDPVEVVDWMKNRRRRREAIRCND